MACPSTTCITLITTRGWTSGSPKSGWTREESLRRPKTRRTARREALELPPRRNRGSPPSAPASASPPCPRGLPLRRLWFKKAQIRQCRRERVYCRPRYKRSRTRERGAPTPTQPPQNHRAWMTDLLYRQRRRWPWRSRRFPPRPRRRPQLLLKRHPRRLHRRPRPRLASRRPRRRGRRAAWPCPGSTTT